jgi:hypothetical protein
MLSLWNQEQVRTCTLIASIQYHCRGPSQYNKTIKRNKRHIPWEGRSKTVLIHRQSDGMSMRNPKESSKESYY